MSNTTSDQARIKRLIKHAAEAQRRLGLAARSVGDRTHRFQTPSRVTEIVEPSPGSARRTSVGRGDEVAGV